jgi:hypothetical protein
VPTEDFRINATVRTTLVRFWIDTSKLDHGAINGVVYLRGRLIREISRTSGNDENEEESVTLLARRLERELKNIRGVRDVVYNLENLIKARGRWMPRKMA